MVRPTPKLWSPKQKIEVLRVNPSVQEETNYFAKSLSDYNLGEILYYLNLFTLNTLFYEVMYKPLHGFYLLDGVIRMIDMGYKAESWTAIKISLNIHFLGNAIEYVFFATLKTGK